MKPIWVVYIDPIEAHCAVKKDFFKMAMPLKTYPLSPLSLMAVRKKVLKKSSFFSSLNGMPFTPSLLIALSLKILFFAASLNVWCSV